MHVSTDINVAHTHSRDCTILGDEAVVVGCEHVDHHFSKFEDLLVHDVLKKQNKTNKQTNKQT